jgi:polyhydroxyalkanoic acid synthase PhaR subunit
MSTEKRQEGSLDPVKLWEQWYDTAAGVWTQNFEGGNEASVDPYGLYRAWLKSAREAQQQLLANTSGMLEPQEAWKRWIDATTEPWRKLIANGADPSGLINRWLDIMAEARVRLLQGNSIPADAFTFFKQWYDATSEAWAKTVGDVSGSDKFLQEASQLLESYMSFVKTTRRASEEYFGHLQLSTRSDIARIAELVINVENKVEMLDETFESFSDSNTQMKAATIDAFTSMAGGIERVEQGLGPLPGALQKVDDKVKKLDATFTGFEKSHANDIASLLSRLEHVEQSLQTLPRELPGVEQLEKRLDTVEGKLDKLLAALEHLPARESAPAPRPAQSTRKTPTSKNGTDRRANTDKVESKA